jgi:surface protein
MFDRCSSLTTIPLLDTSKVTNISIIGVTNNTSLTNLGGFKNLGMAPGLTSVTSNFLSMCPNLTYESIMNVINNLYDRAAAGMSVLTIKFHANSLALLSEDDIAIATNKGWTIS